jgi:glucodextranase-like protein/Kelch motif protein
LGREIAAIELNYSRYDNRHLDETGMNKLGNCFRIRNKATWILAAASVLPGAFSPASAAETNLVVPKPDTMDQGYTETRLLDGKWLVAGGLKRERSGFGRGADGKSLWSGSHLSDEVIISDPTTGNWTNTTPLTAKRAWHTATLLANGRVLVAGGQDDHGDTSSAEIYDAGSRQWTKTGSLNVARRGHSSVLLADGRALVTGGVADRTNYPRTVYFASAELFDPASQQWTVTSPMAVERSGHTATLLTNGLVLVAGGRDQNANFGFSAELYDPATAKWRATGSMTPEARFCYRANLLANGQVLLTVIKVGDYAWEVTNAWAASKELYDPVTGKWQEAGPPRPHFVSGTNLDRTLTISPPSGTSFLASEEVYFIVESADRFGVTNIQLFRENVKIAESQDSPLRHSLTNQAAGDYRFVAKASYANGLASTSMPVRLTFRTAGPQVSIGFAERYTHSSPAVLYATVAGVDPGGLKILTLNGVRQPIRTGNFTLSRVLAEGENTFVLAATDKHGRTARATNTVYFDSIPPLISISEPTNHASLNIMRVGVRGTFSEKLLKRITVNGMPAFVGNNTFEVPNVFLQPGTNIIAALAEDLAGNSTTNAITIAGPDGTNAYATDPVQLIANPAGGFAPLRVSFTVKANVPGEIKRVLYDFDGDHIADKTAKDLQPIDVTFAEAGDRVPVVTLETAAGRFSSLGDGGWFSGTRVSVQAAPVLLSAIHVDDPIDIKCPDTNHLYVLSGVTTTLSEFTIEGTPIRSLKNIAGKPSSFDVDEAGNVYLALSGSNQVWKFTPTTNSFAPDVSFGNGGFIGNRDGGSGSKSNELSAPFDVAVTRDFNGRTIVVSDSGNHRIERFSESGKFVADGYHVGTNGEFISSFGSRGTNAAQFNDPKGLCFGGSHEYLFIADSGNDRVTVASAGFGPLATSGATGAALGQFRGPSRVCASDRGVCVVDPGNDRIQTLIR